MNKQKTEYGYGWKNTERRGLYQQMNFNELIQIERRRLEMMKSDWPDSENINLRFIECEERIKYLEELKEIENETTL